MDLLIHIRPSVLIDPGRRIRRHLNIPRRTCQQESELVFFEHLVTEEDLGGEHEGEDEFMLLEQRTTDVLVETVGEVLVHTVEPFV